MSYGVEQAVCTAKLTQTKLQTTAFLMCRAT